MAPEQPPNYWSAATGYTNIIPVYQPMSPPPPPVSGFWVPVAYPGPPQQPQYPLVAPPYSWVPAPVPYYSVPVQAHPPTPTPVPTPVPAPAAKTKKARIASPPKGDGAPKTLPGSTYLYPESHVRIHWTTAKVWKRDVSQFDHQILNVGMNFTVKELMDSIGGGKGFALTEVVERGGGQWSKGFTVRYEEGGKFTLAKLGWTAKRGDSQEPLWVVLWKPKA